MTDYFLAPSLAALREELNDKYPKRDKASDGWIGDPRHQAESYSDHNPLWGCSNRMTGVVRALDIDNNGAVGELTPLVRDVLDAAIGDPRVWYVIWDRKIYSRTYGWQARAYVGTGLDPHTNHVHVSIQGHNLPNQCGIAAQAAAFNTQPWLGTTPKPVTTLPVLHVSNAQTAYKHPRKAVKPTAAKRIQRALNAHGANLKVDGIYGKSTRQAMADYKKSQKMKSTSGWPGVSALTKLGKNRWRLAK